MKVIVEKLWNSIEVIMALLMVTMIALVFTNVVLRFGFSSSFRPSVELSRMCFVWVVMLGAVVVLRRDEHLAVTEITDVFFPRAVPFLRRIGWAIILLAVGMLFWGSFRQMMANWNNISQLTGLPSGLFYAAGFISGGLMAFVAVIRIFNPDAFATEDGPNK